jgi:hypothetical protein
VLSKQCDGLAGLSSTSSTANTVHIVLNGQGELQFVSRRRLAIWRRNTHSDVNDQLHLRNV